jgi:hypothetical protein
MRYFQRREMESLSHRRFVANRGGDLRSRIKGRRRLVTKFAQNY